MGYNQGRMQYNETHKPTMNLIRKNIQNAIKIIEENQKNIIYVPDPSVSESFSEKNMPAELRDACILAQQTKATVLTDDFLYLQVNSLETKKDTPKHFSSISIVKILFENGDFSLEEYLNYFHYLTSYRFHFLHELEKAVLINDGDSITIKPENIKPFNLRLILSKEYGVDPQAALMVIINFLLRIIRNDSISIEDAVRIFEEINSQFLSENPFFSNTAIQICEKIIKNYPRPLGVPSISKIEQAKLTAIDKKIKELGI